MTNERERSRERSASGSRWRLLAAAAGITAVTACSPYYESSMRAGDASQPTPTRSPRVEYQTVSQRNQSEPPTTYQLNTLERSTAKNDQGFVASVVEPDPNTTFTRFQHSHSRYEVANGQMLPMQIPDRIPFIGLTLRKIDSGFTVFDGSNIDANNAPFVVLAYIPENNAGAIERVVLPYKPAALRVPSQLPYTSVLRFDLDPKLKHSMIGDKVTYASLSIDPNRRGVIQTEILQPNIATK